MKDRNAFKNSECCSSKLSEWLMWHWIRFNSKTYGISFREQGIIDVDRLVILSVTSGTSKSHF
jgi:hypothetical protein